MKLTVGSDAPEFTLPDQYGVEHSLSDYRGRWVLVYFYPKDNTPGCTKEACALRDSFPDSSDADAVVIGISTDPVESHRKFAEKLKLPFVLLADEAKEVVKRYGVWGRKKLAGCEYMGTRRASFLVDPAGTVRKIYDTVKPAEHAEEVLADLTRLMS